jgi:hypothetical protein
LPDADGFWRHALIGGFWAENRSLIGQDPSIELANSRLQSRRSISARTTVA